MGVAVASASPGDARGAVPEEAAGGANDVYVCTLYVLRFTVEEKRFCKPFHSLVTIK